MGARHRRRLYYFESGNRKSRARPARKRNYTKKMDRLCACSREAIAIPVVYVEYSGRYGDPELVSKVADSLSSSRLFYGGGVDGADKAAIAAQMADTVVVGNIIYENLPQALETVAAVKQARKG